MIDNNLSKLPDTICPPLATTIYPELVDANVIAAVLTLLKLTCSGMSWLSFVSYTAITKFLLSKLWSTLTLWCTSRSTSCCY